MRYPQGLRHWRQESSMGWTKEHYIILICKFSALKRWYRVSQVVSLVSGPNYVNYLNQTPIFEWWVVRYRSWIRHQKDMCSKEIVLHTQNFLTILGWLVNIIGGGGDLCDLMAHFYWTLMFHNNLRLAPKLWDWYWHLQAHLWMHRNFNLVNLTYLADGVSTMEETGHARPIIKALPAYWTVR